VPYTILISFGMSNKVATSVKMRCNETYSKGRINQHLSDTLPIHNGLTQDALSPQAFKFTLLWTSRKVLKHEDGLKSNGPQRFFLI
jgi:hypothetical protein